MRVTRARSAFAAALCAGVAMIGASVHGMLSVDAELQRSAVAAGQLERPPQFARAWDCPAEPAARLRV